MAKTKAGMNRAAKAHVDTIKRMSRPDLGATMASAEEDGAEKRAEALGEAIKALKTLDPKFGFFLAIENEKGQRTIGCSSNRAFYAVTAAHLIFKAGKPDNPLEALFS